MTDLKSNAFRVDKPLTTFQITVKILKSFEDSYLFKLENKNLKYKLMCKLCKETGEIQFIEYKKNQGREITLNYHLEKDRLCDFTLEIGKEVKITFTENIRCILRSLSIPPDEETILFKPISNLTGTGIEIIRFEEI